MDKVKESLSKNLKRARQQLGYSQMKLAELSDLSTSYIAEIEMGKKLPSSSTILKLSNALGMKAYQLFVEDENGAEWDRVELVTSIGRELKDMLNDDIEDVIKKHIS